MAYSCERILKTGFHAHKDHWVITVPYERHGLRHEYRPDYLIRWRTEDGSEVKVIVEVKGLETEQDRQKQAAAQRWVRAVNHHGEFGKWLFIVCRDPSQLRHSLQVVV